MAKVQYLDDEIDEAKINIDSVYDELNTNPEFLMDAINVYKNFGKLHTLQKNYTDAKNCYVHAFNIFKKIFGIRNPSVLEIEEILKKNKLVSSSIF